MSERSSDREAVRRVRHEPENSRTISTENLKELVCSKFPPNHPLRLVVPREKEHLTPEEFLAKMETWLILLNQSK